MSGTRKPSYTIGFQNCTETFQAQPLEVEGEIPSWVEGTLFRNGPGTFDVALKDEAAFCTFDHWFDALTMLHKFTVHGNEVFYQSAHMVPECETHIRERGGPAYLTFGQDPCASLFQKVKGLFRKPDAERNPKTGEPLTNVGVTVDKMLGKWVQTTDASMLAEFDPATLEAKTLLSYPELSPDLPEGVSAAHPAFDQSTGEHFNFSLSFGPGSAFHLFSLSEKHPQGRPLTVIPQEPSYVHSLALTERYLVLVTWPLYFGWKGLKVLWEQNIRQSFVWKPEQGCRFFVVDRESGELVGEWKSPTFFCFHHINAFEQGADLILDMATYEDATLIDALRLRNLRDLENFTIPEGRVDRFVLREVLAGHGEVREVECQRLCDHTVELPRINERFARRDYRYVYGVGNSVPHQWIDRIVKFDVKTKTSMIWQEAGMWPAEPIFLPAPNATKEDEGVLLSIVLDETNANSALLVLDAATMQPLARAVVPAVVPFGFHGTWTEERW